MLNRLYVLYSVTCFIIEYTLLEVSFMTKPFLVCLSLTLCFSVAALAFASDGESMYKSNCSACHGSAGEKGNSPLNGQTSDDIVKKMKGYADGSYGGEKKKVMEAIAKKHAEDVWKTIADFIGKK